jgi:hypothetical protein
MNPPYRRKKKKKKTPKIVYQNNMSVIKFNINNYNSKSNNLIDSFKLNNSKNIFFANNQKKQGKEKNIVHLKTTNKHLIYSIKKHRRRKIKFKDKKDNLIVNKFIKGYLSTDYDELDYDYAIKMDNRKFLPFFWERVKKEIIYIIYHSQLQLTQRMMTMNSVILFQLSVLHEKPIKNHTL